MSDSDDDTEKLINVETRHLSIQWVIEKYIEKSAEERNLLISSNFMLIDSDWCLEIDNNIEADNDRVDWMTLHLRRQRVGCIADEDHVAVILGMKKGDGSVHKSYSFKHVFSWKKASVFVRCEKNSVLCKKGNDILTRKGSLIVFCDIRLMEGIRERTCQTVTPEGLVALVQNFKNLCLDGKHSDITIKVGGQDFRAHRSILATRSPVFASLIEQSTSDEDCGCIVTIDFDPISFKIFLLFLYTGKVDGISSDNVFGLYNIAHKFEFKRMKEECIQFIIRDLCVASFYNAVLLAKQHGESELMKTATDFFIFNVNLITPTEDWQIFMKNNPILANELLY